MEEVEQKRRLAHARPSELRSLSDGRLIARRMGAAADLAYTTLEQYELALNDEEEYGPGPPQQPATAPAPGSAAAADAEGGAEAAAAPAPPRDSSLTYYEASAASADLTARFRMKVR